MHIVNHIMEINVGVFLDLEVMVVMAIIAQIIECGVKVVVVEDMVEMEVMEMMVVVEVVVLAVMEVKARWYTMEQVHTDGLHVVVEVEDIAVMEEGELVVVEDIMLMVETGMVEEEVMAQEEMDGCGQKTLDRLERME